MNVTKEKIKWRLDTIVQWGGIKYYALKRAKVDLDGRRFWIKQAWFAHKEIRRYRNEILEMISG